MQRNVIARLQESDFTGNFTSHDKMKTFKNVTKGEDNELGNHYAKIKKNTSENWCLKIMVQNQQKVNRSKATLRR